MEPSIQNFEDLSKENCIQIKSLLLDPSAQVQTKVSLMKTLQGLLSDTDIERTHFLEAKVPSALLQIRKEFPDKNDQETFYDLIITLISPSEFEYQETTAPNMFSIYKYIPNDDKEIFMSAVWILSEVCNKEKEYAKRIADSKIIFKILPFIEKETDLNYMKIFLSFLSWLTLSQRDYESVKPSVNYLKYFIKFCYDPSFCEDFLWFVTFITETQEDLSVVWKDLSDSQILKEVFEAFFPDYISSNTNFSKPFVRMIFNLTQDLEIAKGILSLIKKMDYIINFLEDSAVGTRKYASYIFSNLIQLKDNAITEKILSVPNLFPLLTKILKEDEMKVKTPCVIAISVLLEDDFEELKLLDGIIEVIFDLANNCMFDFKTVIIEACLNYYEKLKKTYNKEKIESFKSKLLEFEKNNDNLYKYGEAFGKKIKKVEDLN